MDRPIVRERSPIDLSGDVVAWGPKGTTVTSNLYACERGLSLSVEADRAAVKRGETVSYSATVRQAPRGLCLDTAGLRVPGQVSIKTTEFARLEDAAMWLEIEDGATRKVLPSASGLTVSGDAPPAACPAGDCSGAIQASVGALDPASRSFPINSPSAHTLWFEFRPTLSAEDLEAIRTAPSGAVDLVIALTLSHWWKTTRTVLHRVDATFSPLTPETVANVMLQSWLGRRQFLQRELGPLAPGEEIKADAGFYTASDADGDVIESAFTALVGNRAAAPDDAVVTTTVTD
jgi:hypothetical protein